MAGDPDWGEIIDRCIQIRSDALAAPTVRSATESEIATVLAPVVNELIEQAARMDILMYRMAQGGVHAPGMSHGVGLHARTVALLVELHRRLVEGIYVAGSWREPGDEPGDLPHRGGGLLRRFMAWARGFTAPKR